MTKKAWLPLGLLAMSAFLWVGCSAPTTSTTADSSTTSSKSGPSAPPSGAGTGGQTENAGGASASLEAEAAANGEANPPAASNSGSTRRGPMGVGSGGQAVTSGQDAAATQQSGRTNRRGPQGVGSDGSTNQANQQQDSSSSNMSMSLDQESGQQGSSQPGRSGLPAGSASGGQSGPPPGTNYGGQSGPPPGTNYGGQSGPPPGTNYGGQSGPPPGANYGGQSGPPPGANYGGQSGPPPGSNYGGQSGPPPGSNYGGQSGPPPGANQQGRSGAGRGPTGVGSDGSTSTAGAATGGGAGGESMTLDGGSPPPSANNGGGGAGGESMTLDGGGPPPNRGNGFGGPAAQAPVEVVETSFYDMAINAFAKGDDAKGYRYLQAELASNRTRFDEMPLSFWSQQRRPEVGIRFGVGVEYIAQQGVTQKAPVIGDPAPTINRNNGRGGPPPGAGSSNGPGGFGGQGGGVPADARGHLEYYGGDLAKALIEKLEQRFKGDNVLYGSAFSQLNVKVVMPGGAASTANSNSGAAAAAGRGRSGPSRGPGGAGSGGPPADFNNNQGGNQGSAEGLFPGLVMLGEGTFADLIKKAKKEGLDGVFVLEQRGTMARRTGQVGSQTTLKFYDCESGKEKASTSSMNYAVVASARASNSDASKDPVEKELVSMFDKKLDKMYSLRAMPTLDGDQSVGRLKSIFEESKDDPMPFLIEANYYVHQGWLPEDKAQEYIIALIGEPSALKLFDEDFEKQKSGLSKWLPK